MIAVIGRRCHHFGKAQNRGEQCDICQRAAWGFVSGSEQTILPLRQSGNHRIPFKGVRCGGSDLILHRGDIMHEIVDHNAKAIIIKAADFHRSS